VCTSPRHQKPNSIAKCTLVPRHLCSHTAQRPHSLTCDQGWPGSRAVLAAFQIDHGSGPKGQAAALQGDLRTNPKSHAVYCFQIIHDFPGNGWGGMSVSCYIHNHTRPGPRLDCEQAGQHCPKDPILRSLEQNPGLRCQGNQESQKVGGYRHLYPPGISLGHQSPCPPASRESTLGPLPMSHKALLSPLLVVTGLQQIQGSVGATGL
jgi:hypothetical protein